MLKPFIFLLISLISTVVFGSDNPCSTIHLSGDKIKLTDTEKIMLCGDSKTPGYEKIPPYQAQYFMTGFLQSRGYLRPKFEIKDEDLYVDVGPISKVKKIYIDAENKKLKHEVKSEMKHLFHKRELETSLLNAMEGEALGLVRERGYPCAKVKSAVDMSKDNVYISLLDLRFHKFGEVKKEKIEGLRDNALERYYPFRANGPFNVLLLNLTERRMRTAQVVQGTYFIEDCKENDFSIAQNFITGPSRGIRYGAGATTELGLMVRARWSNNRYKSMASIIAADFEASFRTQSLTLSADSFHWHNEPRRSVYTQLQFLRESQIDYEQTLLRATPHIKWTRDSEGFSKVYEFGPSYEGGHYFSGGNSDVQYFSTGILNGSMQWMTHKYELFEIHPEEGQVYGLTFDFRDPAFGFNTSLFKLDTTMVKLDRLMNSGRGTLVGGVRIGLGSAWVPSDVNIADLPPTVKFYGGGSDDIRGFLLRSLPENNGLGALTRAMLKLELRRTYLWRPSIEGFAFLDSARFGETSWSLDPSLYYSPGVGIRWVSKIGSIQGYVSRGYVTRPWKDEGYFYYAGIGGTF